MTALEAAAEICSSKWPGSAVTTICLLIAIIMATVATAWHAMEDRELTAHLLDHCRRERTALIAELLSANRRAVQAEQRAFNAGKESPVTVASVAGFSQEDLKRIRNLCHPDKHGGSKAATEITQLLNSKLKR